MNELLQKSQQRKNLNNENDSYLLFILCKKLKILKAARFELAPVKTGALNQRLRPLGHASSSIRINLDFLLQITIYNPIHNLA